MIYFAARTFFAKVELRFSVETGGKSKSSILHESVVVEVLNPKTALFFIALLPQFVDAAAPVAPQILLLGFIVTLTAIPCDLGVAVGAGKAARWLRGNVKPQKLQNRVSGEILLGLGAYVAIAGRQD